MCLPVCAQMGRLGELLSEVTCDIKEIAAWHRHLVVLLDSDRLATATTTLLSGERVRTVEHY